MDSEVVQAKTIRSLHTAYSVKNIIGKGRFSCVYKATDMSTDDTVVIKKLHKKTANSDDFDWYLYLKELTLLTELKSSPVRARYVSLRDAMRLETGAICFVMEKLGTTLHSVLFNIGVLPMSMCRMIVRQIAQGLAGLKCMGIVHADLKPDNIMFCAGIGNNHLVKIIDFGWAFHIRDAHAMHRKKMQAVPYRAPEVCFRGNPDHGLDMWSLGCIMPEIVVGAKLFDVYKEELLVKLIMRTLDVPDSLASVLQAKDDEDAINLSTGWVRFQNLKSTYAGCPQKSEDVCLFADLVYKMLSVMPECRITAVDALAHPFLTMTHFIKYPSTDLTKTNAKLMRKCALDI